MFQTINPATGEILQTYSYAEPSRIEQVLSELNSAGEHWQVANPAERTEYLLRLAAELRSRKDILARTMALEMGKPLVEGLAEVEKCALAAKFYAENCAEFVRTEDVRNPGDGRLVGQVLKQPLGIIFAIMPWNFPCWQVVRFAAPAICAGNAVLLKHSEITEGTAHLLQEAFSAASNGAAGNGLKLFQQLALNHDQAAAVIADPRIRGVTFTGSSRGGREVAAVAGRNLKKSVMELGGSDAYLVLKDAQIAHAAEICAKARLVNNGQSCVAAKRFLVDRSIKEEFVHHFEKYLKSYRQGDPLVQGTQLGPLAHKKFQKQLISQVNQLNGRLLFGGNAPEGPGAYFPVTLLEMSESSQIWSEEFFGPVACLWGFADESEAIARANRSVFGLGGAVFSTDINRAEELAAKMECGFVAINDMVKSDPRLPFGGVKDSGYGRELGRFGLDEFLNVKSKTISGA